MKEFENKDPGIREELQNIGSQLGRHEPDDGFKVPEDYFAQLPNIIQDRILQQRNQRQPALNALAVKRLWPVFASVVVLIGLTFSIFLIQRNGVNGFLADEEPTYELEYLINNPVFGQHLFYEAILESDLSAYEILYNLDYDDIDDPDTYDDLMEHLFEKANYFGIESSYLLSYLD